MGLDGPPASALPRSPPAPMGATPATPPHRPRSLSPPRRGPQETNELDSMVLSPQSSASSQRDPAVLARRANGFAADFRSRDSVVNIHREVDVGVQSPAIVGRDVDVRVFQEEPKVRVIGGRSEDAWPTRYVEYDVELKYKNFTWQVEIPKSTVYGLWFFVKSKIHGLTARGNQSGGSAGSTASASAIATWAIPQMRKLFLANAEKSVSPEMVALVQQYLDAVVRIPALLHTATIVEMFQVSNSTFDDEEGYTSVREGWLKVRMWLKGNQDNVRINRGAITCDNECFNCMCVVKRVNFKSKKWRWVALKHSSIAVFPSIQDTRASEVFLFDQKFNIERGIQSAGSNTALLVSNSTYVMQLEAKTKQSIVKWANDIRKTAERSDWSQSHRDDSFAIPRQPQQFASYAKWFVDGKDAYQSIYDSLRSARKEIFIAGWWICPTIHLLRPASVYPHSRLDLVLQRKAEEGVKIYILMYKEVSVALTLNSNFSKKTFRRLHPDIHVLRDPDFLMKHLGMWSHHEKIVSVDQKVAFVGGLDLCFGRWDTGDHFLFDESSARTNFQGKDYSNPRVKDFIDVHLPEKDLIDRSEVPRMPWHDCHCRLEGQPARDVARHFIQRWNYSVSTRSKTSKLHHLVPMKDFERTVPKNENTSQMLTRRLQRAVHAVRAMRGLQKSATTASRSASNSYVETVSKDESDKESSQKTSNVSLPSPTSSDRKQSTRVSSDGRLQSHKDRGFNRNRRLSSVLDEGDEDRSDNDSGDDDEDGPSRLENAIQTEKRGYSAACQVLRSISLWSGGCPTERSIQNAYLRLIASANHFIYIENQFFVSGIEGDHACTNRIANALVERIRRAAANKEAFRVMVVMPLLPAFPGKVDDKDSSSLRGVMYWQYRTICRGKDSIYQTLFNELDDPFEYLAFYGLRTHSANKSGVPETEEVYVHSKVMIVDDRSCIIGSANINERSMNGDRDSEIAVLVDDTELDEKTKIAGGTYPVGKFAHSFRMKLFEEHFGVQPGSALYKKYADPVSSETWFTMQDHAMRNCQIYESVFGCLPSDNVTTFKQITVHLEQSAFGGRRDTAVDGSSAGVTSDEHCSTTKQQRQKRGNSTAGSEDGVRNGMATSVNSPRGANRNRAHSAGEANAELSAKAPTETRRDDSKRQTQSPRDDDEAARHPVGTSSLPKSPRPGSRSNSPRPKDLQGSGGRKHDSPVRNDDIEARFDSLWALQKKSSVNDGIDSVSPKAEDVGIMSPSGETVDSDRSISGAIPQEHAGGLTNHEAQGGVERCTGAHRVFPTEVSQGRSA
ncbi:hypothetical protein PINS_up003593 [Pythium insidiosum]|nr:hypothetical protein PINS_up003593 [Pythium insidiosum]